GMAQSALLLGFSVSYYYSILMIELCQCIFKISFYVSNNIKLPVLVSIPVRIKIHFMMPNLRTQLDTF
ncbi:hypothetical protein, partial [Klebsiella pneumoniae]